MPGSIPGRNKRLFLGVNVARHVKLTPRPYIVPRLRMNAAIPLVFLYTLMANERATLRFFKCGNTTVNHFLLKIETVLPCSCESNLRWLNSDEEMKF